MRGLLLYSRQLKEQVQPAWPGIGKTPILQTTFDDPIFYGVQSNRSAAEADKRLRDRFLSLFFWPAVMANVKPNERRDVFDIYEEEEVVAACHPLETADIIAEAQSKASLNPVIVRPQKRKSEAPKKVQQEKIVQHSGSSEEEIEEQERQVAPPPIKKRLLVSMKSFTE